jgi:hypothetical protein
MNKKTTIEDAIALLGFATTPAEKGRAPRRKYRAIEVAAASLVVYAQSETKKTSAAKQKRFGLIIE